MVRRIESGSFRSFGPVGSSVVSLAVGDPDIPTPPHIVEALERAIESGYTHYVERAGDPELRSAVAAKLSATAGSAIAPGEILITHGSSAGLASAMLAILEAGDKVLIPQPSYSLYADLSRLAGAVPVFLPQDENFHLDLEAVEAAAPAARMIVICNPCNPTGAVYSASELLGLAEIAVKHDLWLLADEAYDHIVFDGRHFASSLSVSGIADRLLYVQTFSKTYAMTGWRLGFLKAPIDVTNAADRIHQTFNGCVNAAVQRAALAAIGGPQDWLVAVREEYQYRRDLIGSMLEGVAGLEVKRPEGTFYFFLPVPARQSSVKWAELVLGRGVAVRPGVEFGPGGDGHIRISFSVPRERLVEGLERLRDVYIHGGGEPASGSLPGAIR